MIVPGSYASPSRISSRLRGQETLAALGFQKPGYDVEVRLSDELSASSVLDCSEAFGYTCSGVSCKCDSQQSTVGPDVFMKPYAGLILIKRTFWSWKASF